MLHWTIGSDWNQKISTHIPKQMDCKYVEWKPAIFRSPLRLFGKGGRPEREKLIVVCYGFASGPSFVPNRPIGPFESTLWRPPFLSQECSWWRFLLLCLSDTAAPLSLSHLQVVFRPDKEIASSGCGPNCSSCSSARLAKPPFLSPLWTASTVSRV